MTKNDSIRTIETIETYQGEGFKTGDRVLLIRYKNCSRNLGP